MISNKVSRLEIRGGIWVKLFKIVSKIKVKTIWAKFQTLMSKVECNRYTLYNTYIQYRRRNGPTQKPGFSLSGEWASLIISRQGNYIRTPLTTGPCIYIVPGLVQRRFSSFVCPVRFFYYSHSRSGFSITMWVLICRNGTSPSSKAHDEPYRQFEDTRGAHEALQKRQVS